MKPEHIKHWNSYKQKAVPRTKNSEEEARRERIRQKLDGVRDQQESEAALAEVWEDL